MPQNKTSPKYTGILAKPLMAKRGEPDLCSDANLEARVMALFKHYNIDAPDLMPRLPWMKLVVALANDHVPGFRIIDEEEPKRGQPKAWNLISASRLYADIQQGLEQGKSISEACFHLVKKGQPYEGMKKTTLEKRYRMIVRKKSALPLVETSLVRTPEGTKKLMEDIRKQLPPFKVVKENLKNRRAIQSKKK
jgi:hypothetical protein